MHQKYVELTRFNNKGYSTENAWFRRCSETSTPYITIHVHGSSADVQWDYINFNNNLDEKIFAVAPQIHAKANEIYEPISTKDSWISLGPGVVSFKNIAIPDAHLAAERLFDVISGALRLSLSK